MKNVRPPSSGDSWIGLTDEALPVAEAAAWAVRPDCGGVVSFVGTVRDHAGDRTGVTAIDYEAFEEQVEPRLSEIEAEARRRWPTIGRVVLLHRVGLIRVTEASVLVTVSAPHRGEAFAAASFCIDTLKEAAPIWKREYWEGGSDWALGAQPVREVS